MKNFKIVGGMVLILLILGISGLFLYKDFISTKNSENQTNFNTNVERIKDGSTSLTINNSNPSAAKEEVKITQIPVSQSASLKIPDLPKQPVVKRELPEEIKNKTIAQINNLSETLRKDSGYSEGWIELGLLRKLLADYEGAKDAWEYAAFLSPTFHVPFHNLGFIYWQELKDFKKAEENYLKAVKNEPKDIQAYTDLSDLYFFSLKDASKAKEILNKGIKANPSDLALPKALSDLEERINKAN